MKPSIPREEELTDEDLLKMDEFKHLVEVS